MNDSLNKSLSDSECHYNTQCTAPPNFISSRPKRKRDDEFKHELEDFKSEMKAMITSLLTDQSKELKKISSAQREIQDTNLNIEKSIQFLTTQNEMLQKKIEVLEKQSKEDKSYINLLEVKIEDLQREQRKSNLEIKNVPKQPNETKEDLLKMAVCLFKNVGATVQESLITDIYRIRGKKENIQNSPIVIETNSTILKTNILKLCKAFNNTHKTKLCAKHMGCRLSEETPIFVSEHLTAKGSRLHFLARDLAKSKNYTYCWTAYGKIYVRKDNNSPVIPIVSEAQVHHLIQI